VAAGHRVTLLTVFLSGRDAEARRAEDERAAALLGCRHVCLDLFDAVDRPEVRGRLDVFSPFGPPHLGITSEVVARLAWHIQPPAVLRAPLAVGGHIDHHIVHEAARAFCYQQRLALAYYEDLPYSLAPYALARRLAAMDAVLPTGLPGTARAPYRDELQAQREFWRPLPLLKALPPGVRLFGSHLIARAVLAADQPGRRPGSRPRLLPLVREVSAHRATRRAALAAYATQWPQFAASPDELEERLHRYGQGLLDPPLSGAADTAASYERLWQEGGL
jgi:LmbE family N-acetylglucosaminyl deacetylase